MPKIESFGHQFGAVLKNGVEVSIKVEAETCDDRDQALAVIDRIREAIDAVISEYGQAQWLM